MTISTWVVGSTGLLGSAVARRLASDPNTELMSHTVRWSDSPRSLDDLSVGIRRWLDAPGATSFRLIWAAGTGVTATRKNVLENEIATFREFVTRLATEVGKRNAAESVSIFLASSAGGIYSGGSHPPFTELSEALPVSPYGESKLAMEQIVIELARATNIRVVIGRISNLYGPGQRIEKQQGFVSQVCKSMLARHPISVYVSLDTTRDYIFTDDAATVIQACMERVEREDYAGQAVIKNVGSHVPTTLGRVLYEARLVFKRRPSVMLASSPMSTGQSRDLRIQSIVWPEINDLPRRSLLIGLAQTRASMELELQAGGNASR